MKRCKHCTNLPVCKYNYDKTKNDVCENTSDVPGYERKRWKIWIDITKRGIVLSIPAWIVIALIITLALMLAGCSPGQHHGHIYIHDPNHVEAIFDRPMSMSVEQDGIKVEASSLKPGFFEEMIKFLLIRPR